MTKYEYLMSLDKVKLVIGNGFDLRCGLYTTYSDYLLDHMEVYKHIMRWYNIYNNTNVFTANDFYKIINDINLWDAFFALNILHNSNQTNFDWFDVERLILSSLLTVDDVHNNFDLTSIQMVSIVHWQKIEEMIRKNSGSMYMYENFLKNFIRMKARSDESKPFDFYGYLLEELQAFERKFGKFVNDQTHNKEKEEESGGGLVALNKNYIDRFNDAVNELCFIKELVSIDSFNYTHPSPNEVGKNIHHINGSYEQPIFGVDSIYFKPDDKRFIFTKTCRRIDADFIEASKDRTPAFRNVVVYGHSLNEADYNYFFPIFDKLNLLEPNEDKVLVFAYSCYEGANKESIRRNMMNNISKIMYRYAESKELKNVERFLDSLTTQGKIIIYEIKPFSKNVPNFLDDHFKPLRESKGKFLEFIKSISL